MYSLEMKEIEIYIDGASKGNPGPSGIGVVICQDGKTIKNISSYIGNATNNIAEYTALIFALQEALKLKAETVTVNTDSELLYKQIKRLYKIKNPNLLRLYIQFTHLVADFKDFTIKHIPREKNRGADRLATLATIREARNKKIASR